MRTKKSETRDANEKKSLRLTRRKAREKGKEEETLQEKALPSKKADGRKEGIKRRKSERKSRLREFEPCTYSTHPVVTFVFANDQKIFIPCYVGKSVISYSSRL